MQLYEYSPRLLKDLCGDVILGDDLCRESSSELTWGGGGVLVYLSPIPVTSHMLFLLLQEVIHPYVHKYCQNVDQS